MLVKKSGRFRIFMSIITLVLLVSLLAPSLSCGEPENVTETVTTTETETETIEPIVLVFSTTESANSFLVKDIFEPYFAELEKKTNGMLKIEPHYSGELAASLDAYDATVKGTIDMTVFTPLDMASRFPMDGIMAFSSLDVVCHKRGRVMWDLFQTFPEMREQYKDTKVLFMGCMSKGYLGTIEGKPVRTLEDLKGLKVAAPGKWPGERQKALGMVPVSMAPPDIFPSLQKGLIDGLFISLFLLRDINLGEILKYVEYPTQFTLTPRVCVMNLDAYNKLPTDIQEIVTETSDRWLDYYSEAYHLMDVDRMSTAVEEFGVEFIELSKDELSRWAALDEPVWDKFVSELEAQGLPGEELMEEYLRLEQKYAAPEHAFE
jgi:TRAP-type C4-dicarboxylate transport system substrate-binding protein